MYWAIFLHFSPNYTILHHEIHHFTPQNTPFYTTNTPFYTTLSLKNDSGKKKYTIYTILKIRERYMRVFFCVSMSK